jgi:hypothetical protein
MMLRIEYTKVLIVALETTPCLKQPHCKDDAQRSVSLGDQCKLAAVTDPYYERGRQPRSCNSRMRTRYAQRIARTVSSRGAICSGCLLSVGESCVILLTIPRGRYEIMVVERRRV